MKDRILFIAPTFFSYYKRIINVLESDYKVDYISDKCMRLDQISTYRLKWLLYKKKKKYIYKYVIVVKGEYLDHNTLQSLRVEYPNSFFINYQWDDLERFPQLVDNFKFFDKVYTYSKLDSVKYNIDYLPFFYTHLAESSTNVKQFDLSFIGSYHSNRDISIQKLLDINSFDHSYIFLYSTLRQKLLKSSSCNNKLSTTAISYDEYIRISKNSYHVLELPHKSQSNPTTRAIESLGFQSKLITTCSNIVNYDFYNSDNFWILKDDFYIDPEWLKLPYKQCDKDILFKYSIENWINVLLSV